MRQSQFIPLQEHVVEDYDKYRANQQIKGKGSIVLLS